MSQKRTRKRQGGEREREAGRGGRERETGREKDIDRDVRFL